MRTPPVLRLHLTCARLLVPGVTGVNAIKHTPVMVLPAQVRKNMPAAWLIVPTFLHMFDGNLTL